MTVEGVRAAVTVALIVSGVLLLTIGTIGLLRFDTVYNRMHATSKPTTLGTALIFGAGAVHFGPGGAGLTSLLGTVFLFLTVPTGAHMIARAAQRMGVPFRENVTWPEPPDPDAPDEPPARRDRDQPPGPDAVDEEGFDPDERQERR